MTRVLAIGECMIELFLSSHDDTCKIGFAGDTLNTLWYARAGLDPSIDEVSFLTALGHDRQSDRIISFLHSNGICTKHITRIKDKHPGLYMIEQVNGDREFQYWRSDSAARKLAYDDDDFHSALNETDVIYFSGITIAILDQNARNVFFESLKSARKNGKMIAFDPNIRPKLWENKDVMRRSIMQAAHLSDIVLPSFEDESLHFGDETPFGTFKRYKEAGAKEVIVKDSARPVTLHNGLQISVPVQNVVDATAAGDSFNGGYLSARIKNASCEEAVQAGIALSGRVVQKQGAILPIFEMDKWAR